MKKLSIALLLVCLGIGPILAQDASTPESSQRKNAIFVGVGTGNVTYSLVKQADKFQDPNGGYFLSLSTHEVKPLYFIKYENQLGRRHTLGLNFANSGFVIGGVVRDSVFLNDLNVLTETELEVTYRSQSFNLRYNYLFNDDKYFQVYWGIGVGIRGNSISIKTNNPNFSKQLQIPGLNLGAVPTLGFESTLGFRGMITDQLGWYTEIGIAKAALQIGMAYRF